MVKIAPSMLSADFLNLGRDLDMVCGCADIIHLDIMDGVQVPNISYGFPIVEAIAPKATLPMDAHLMIVNPDLYVERFAKAGAAMISFHAEAVENPVPVLEHIRSLGVKAGLAFNPDFPLEKVFPYIKDCDYLVLMSVFAGFGGQKFVEETHGRLAALKAEILRQGAACEIQVDGGVSPANAAQLAAEGADILVAGSAVFRSADPVATVRAMRG